ncbi:MAG: OmpA family protein, partial [Ghiorsea sp.]
YGLLVTFLSACQSTQAQMTKEDFRVKESIKQLKDQQSILIAENKRINEARDQLAEELQSITAEVSNVNELKRQQEILIAENGRIHVTKDDLEKTVQILSSKLAQEIANKQVSLVQNNLSKSILLTLQQRVIFPSGSYTLSLEGQQILDKVTRALMKNSNLNDYKQLRIVGHSDNRPVMKKWHMQFIDNWDLSARRAAAIARYMIWKHGFPAHKIVVVGKANVAPVASNDTEEGRLKNRRIELFVVPKLQSQRQSR